MAAQIKQYVPQGYQGHQIQVSDDNYYDDVLLIISCLAIAAVKERMVNVAHKILVLSGKGGVGKSSFSACLARGLATNDQLQVIPSGLHDLNRSHDHI